MKELCDEYMDELLQLDPTLNDFFSGTSYPKHIQPNVYSEPYYAKLNQLQKKYIQKLSQKSNKTHYDEILFTDLNHSVHLEENFEIYMYIPVDLYTNKLIDYVTECSGNGYYLFQKPSDYKDFMGRMKSLTPITDEIIKKMKSGIKHKVTLYQKVVDEMIEQIQTILKNKSYHQKRVSFKKQWEQCIQMYLVSNLQRLLEFLITEYYPYCSTKWGLQSYKGGKQYYQRLLEYNILKNCNPQILHLFGKKEVKRLCKEIQKLSIQKPRSTYLYSIDIKKKKSFKKINYL